MWRTIRGWQGLAALGLLGCGAESASVPWRTVDAAQDAGPVEGGASPGRPVDAGPLEVDGPPAPSVADPMRPRLMVRQVLLVPYTRAGGMLAPWDWDGIVPDELAAGLRTLETQFPYTIDWAHWMQLVDEVAPQSIEGEAAPDVYVVFRGGASQSAVEFGRSATVPDSVEPRFEDALVDHGAFDLDAYVRVEIWDADPSGDTLMSVFGVPREDLFSLTAAGHWRSEVGTAAIFLVELAVR